MRQHQRQSQVDAYLELLGRECRGWEQLLPAHLSLSDCTKSPALLVGLGQSQPGVGLELQLRAKLKKNPKNCWRKTCTSSQPTFLFLPQAAVPQHPSSQQHQIL